MKIYLLHDHYDKDHLDAVIKEMRVLGLPTIRVYAIDADYGWYQAIEGSHRLRACEALNIRPILEILDSDTPLIDEANAQIIDWDGPLVETIGELGDIDNYSIDF